MRISYMSCACAPSSLRATMSVPWKIN